MTADAGYILSIDQGTTGTTVLVVDAQGQVVDKAYSEFNQSYPKPGWVEHDPIEIWQTTQRLITQISRSNRQIVGIGITNQRETTVVWDRQTGQPVYPAIVWQCRRTTDHCAKLKAEGNEEWVRQKTGLVLDPYFSATKIAWILDRVDPDRHRAENGDLAFGTIDTWLLWHLTGGAIHATDFTNASRTLLFDIDRLTWDTELLQLFRVPKALLPTVHPSRHHFGQTMGLNSLPDWIPIAGIAGDQQAALFGQLCTKQGMVKNTYGTGCFLLMRTGNQRIPSQSGLLTTLACSSGTNEDDVAYALEGSVFVAGAAVQWLRDELQIIQTAAETEQISDSISDSGGVYVVPAFTGLGAPYWKAQARGAILNLTRGVGRAEIVRATLESIAYQTVDVVSAMVADANVSLDRLRVDGGAVANNFLMQFQADLLDTQVERPTHIETTGLGAAYLAGLTVGLWDSVETLEKYRQVDRVFVPSMTAETRSQNLSGWRQAVDRVVLEN